MKIVYLTNGDIIQEGDKLFNHKKKWITVHSLSCGLEYDSNIMVPMKRG